MDTNPSDQLFGAWNEDHIHSVLKVLGRILDEQEEKINQLEKDFDYLYLKSL